jgi:hypothetical protein
MKHSPEYMQKLLQDCERELAASQAGQAELLARLEERTQSHIHASARDVQTIQQQAVELAKWQALAEGLADALRCISAHDGPGFPHGTCGNIAGQALAAYEAAKSANHD